MTADLVERLDAEADYTHSLIAETVGDRRTLLAEREALLREAASALRSSGEAVAWVPEGYELVAVKGFHELVCWLDRCADKGHLDNCPDLIEPWEAFDYRTPPTSTKGG